jgi:hypothetical protein
MNHRSTGRFHERFLYLIFIAHIVGVILLKKPGSAIPLTTIHVRFGRLTATAMIGIEKPGLFLAGFFAA